MATVLLCRVYYLQELQHLFYRKHFVRRAGDIFLSTLIRAMYVALWRVVETTYHKDEKERNYLREKLKVFPLFTE
jgi:hypothetical protein